MDAKKQWRQGMWVKVIQLGVLGEAWLDQFQHPHTEGTGWCVDCNTQDVHCA